MAVVAEADKLRQQGIDVWISARASRISPRRSTSRTPPSLPSRITLRSTRRWAARPNCATRSCNATRPTSIRLQARGMHRLGRRQARAVQCHSGAGRSRRRSHPAGAVLGVVQGHRALCRRQCVLLQADESQGFRVTAEMVARLVTPRTKIIILNSPSNPSGAVMCSGGYDSGRALGARARHLGVSDECYVYLNYTGETFPWDRCASIASACSMIGSLSKTYAMTGWRLGYALAPAPVSGDAESCRASPLRIRLPSCRRRRWRR